MEYVQGREGYYEEEDEEMAGQRGNHPFSSSSSSSPSYCQYKSLIPQPNLTYDPGMLNFHGQDLRRQESDGGETSGAGVGFVEKEHMFDKVVTPSDVGKLNRLVIPKQHAEKYFPLDSSANEKGLLLNFEDRGGKPWRFRYSYWNSSQSYVMTKGWSRFVKEKKLDAGDIVSFERGVGELGKDRLFIDWSRRPDAPDRSTMSNLAHLPHSFSLPLARSVPWGRFFMPPPAMSMPERDYMHLQQMNYDNFHHQRISYSGGSYGYNVVNPSQGPVIHLRSITPQQVGRVEEGVDHVPMVFDSVPVVQGKAAAKRVRLFGVNLDCPIQEDPECDILSSTTISHSSMVSLSSSSHLVPSPPSSSSSSLPHLQLRLFNGSLLPPEFPKQGKSSMSFDLDI